MTVAQPAVRSETVATASPPLIAPHRLALFLDLDGTLAPIMPRPDDVGPDPRRARLLARLYGESPAQGRESACASS